MTPRRFLGKRDDLAAAGRDEETLALWCEVGATIQPRLTGQELVDVCAYLASCTRAVLVERAALSATTPGVDGR